MKTSAVESSSKRFEEDPVAARGLRELLDLFFERDELIAGLDKRRCQTFVAVRGMSRARRPFRQAVFSRSMDLTGGGIELATGQGQLVFEQLHLTLKLLHLSVVLGDPALSRPR